MATRPPTPDPSNRLPWIVLAVVVLLVVVGVGAFLVARRPDTSITIQGTPQAALVSPSVPATLAAPTLPPSQPTTTPQPSPTAQPSPTPVPVATKPPPPTAAPAAPAPTPPPAAAAPTVAPAPPTPAPGPPASPVAQASPAPVSGQIAGPGGLANTRPDLDAAFGGPTGETAEHLVVYRKDNLEYHVQFAPDLNGRAALIVEVPPSNPPMTVDAAMAEARKLLPRDAQPPSPPPEGNDQFVVQRFTSQSLLGALGPDAFTTQQAAPGEFMVVYAREPAQNGRVTRIVLGPGHEPAALLDRGR